MSKRIIKLVISGIVKIFDCSVSSCRKALRLYPSSTCIILYYHVIESSMREKFAWQLDAILESAVAMDLNSLGDTQPERVHRVIVTFDDASRSVSEIAVPELVARNIPATVFVPVSYIGLAPGWIGSKGHPAHVFGTMKEDEIRRHSENGTLNFGSHCMTHRDLQTINEEESAREIALSKHVLESITGKKVRTLSLPHGGYKRTDILLAQEAGYERVLTINPTLEQLGRIGFLVGRVKVDPEDWKVEFKLKLTGAYRWMEAYSKMKVALKDMFALLTGKKLKR